MEEEMAMKNPRRILAIPLICACALVLYGCGAVSQHAKAIEQAIVGYSDYYIEVRNLQDQVTSGYEHIDPKQSAVTYSITVNIPDYSSAEFQSVPYPLPKPDFNAKNAALYQKKAVLALRQAVETYALNNGASSYVELPVSFDVVSSGNGWAASLTSKSKVEIQKTVETMMVPLLLANDQYKQNFRLALVSDELNTLLADAVGGEEYATLIEIVSIESIADGNYSVLVSYPDPEAVFAALGEAYAASFNQPFYGEPLTVSLTARGLSALDTSTMPRVEDGVMVSFDAETNTCALIEAASLFSRVSFAKQQAEETTARAVNARWHVAPLDPPDSGAVLEGASAGNQIVIKTGATLGRYYYVRFFAISGEDVSEEGTMTAGLFMVGGKTAKINLPSGYYRVACTVGENWYGLEALFGKEGKQYAGKSAIVSREGYINTISFQ